MKQRNNNSRFALIASLLAVLSLAFITYVKYDLNHLPIANYSFSYIGNVLNLIITFILFTGLVFIGYVKKIDDKKRKNFATSLLILGIICIILSFSISKMNLFNKDQFVFNIPIRKAYTGFLMILSMFISVYVLLYIWGMVLEFDKLFELRTLLRALFAFMLLFIFSMFFVWNVNAYSESNINGKKFKYGFVPGAAVYSKGKPSPIFEARIRKAFELLGKNKIEMIVLTGGKAPGEITEAEAAYKYLINLKVDPKKIIIENETSTTTEQVKFLKFKLLSKTESEKILVISDGFHLSRVLQICKFFRLNAVGVASEYSLSFEKTLFYRTRESIALLLFWFFAI